ncbi:MAG: hypothetical protein QM765_18065 [Myxococcales bacterium]
MNGGARRRLAAVATACTLALALGGCPSMMRPPRAGSEAPKLSDREAEKRYQDVLGQWTRRAEIYDGLDSQAFLAATFQPLVFREARVERVAAFGSLPKADAEAMLAQERQKHAAGLDFVLGLYANEKRFDDLANPDSVWKLALATEAGEEAPLSIVKLDAADPNLRALYPYLDAYWTAYQIRFARTFANGAQVVPATTQGLVLRLSSSVGKAELRWDLAALPASGAPAWP